MTDTLLYIPVQTEDVARRLSAGVFALAKPLGFEPEPGDSRYVFQWFKHPQSDVAVLEIDTTTLVFIHPEASGDYLLEIVADATDAQIRDLLAAYVRDSRGKRVPLINLVPPAARLEAMTRDQAVAAGFIKTTL